MNKKDYEKYYQTGGSYIIPIEIFNELFDDYGCFKNDYQKYKEKIDKAIEYIETATIDPQSMLHYRNCLLDILKGDNNE